MCATGYLMFRRSELGDGTRCGDGESLSRSVQQERATTEGYFLGLSGAETESMLWLFPRKVDGELFLWLNVNCCCLQKTWLFRHLIMILHSLS